MGRFFIFAFLTGGGLPNLYLRERYPTKDAANCRNPAPTGATCR